MITKSNARRTSGYVIGIIVLGVIADYSQLGIYVMLRVSLIFASIAFIFAILLYFIKTPPIEQNKMENTDPVKKII